VTDDIDQLIRKVVSEPIKPKELEALQRIAHYARTANPKSLEEARADLAICRCIAEEILEPDHLYQLEPETIPDDFPAV
jgi:hypothetical protein